jgi:hypothetical protein
MEEVFSSILWMGVSEMSIFFFLSRYWAASVQGRL